MHSGDKAVTKENSKINAGFLADVHCSAFCMFLYNKYLLHETVIIGQRSYKSILLIKKQAKALTKFQMTHKSKKFYKKTIWFFH